MTPGPLARLVAAVVLTAATGAVLPASPAAAATCGGDTGVSVVVDFSKLGGGIATTCVADGGGDTASSIVEVDHDLTRVQQFPGAVCRVDDTPSDAPCQNMPPADAYWGLFWSDGSGGWTYSSEGVDSLNIPDGGSVAFAWQDGGDRDNPGVAPPQTADEPSSSPTPTPSPDPGGGGSGGSGSGGSGGAGGGGSGGGSDPSTSPTSAPTPSADPTGDGSGGDGDGNGDGGNKADKGGKGTQGDTGDTGDDESSDSPSPTLDPSDDPSDAVPAAEPPADATGSGLPAWVAPIGIAGLFSVAGVIALLRRRQST